MKYLRAFALTLLLLAIALAATAANDAPFFFVQLADTQLGFTKGNSDLTTEIEHFTKAVEHINRLKPAFVIISGDLVNAAHNPKQIRAFWKVAREISPGIPLHLVAGNHDVGNKPTAADVGSYTKLMGADHYSFSYNGTKFIVLDSALLGTGSDTVLRDAQRKWFETELAAAQASKASHTFVCTHHPFFLTKPDEPDAYRNIPLAQRGDYLDLMNRYGVDYAISGHLHFVQTARDRNVTLVTGGPLSKSIAKPPVVGLCIWRVYKDRVESQFYGLDKLPESVKM